MSSSAISQHRFVIAFLVLIFSISASICAAADTKTKKGTEVVSQSTEPKVLDEENIEVDQWPFTIRTLQFPDKYVIMAFLRNMPVSHQYVVENKTLESQKAAGNDPLKHFKELARKDLKAGMYRTWVIHWASQ